MTNQRRIIQEAHEKFTVGLFLKNFNHYYHTDFVVIDEPNPPEAIIQSKRTTRWVEVTTAYMNKEFAIELNSYATEGETYKPRSEGVLIEPDKQFAEQFINVIKQKLEKSSYEQLREKYGHGYLVVSIQYPLFGRRTLNIIDSLWSQTQINNKNCFKSIYITYQRTFEGYKVSIWRPFKASKQA